MYDFHHNYIKQKYLDSTRPFKDTDSLTYQIQTINAYENFYGGKHLLDFSGCEKESPFYNNENKKVIGKIKDELNGEIIEEFVGLSDWGRKCILWKQKKKKWRQQRELTRT